MTKQKIIMLSNKVKEKELEIDNLKIEIRNELNSLIAQLALAKDVLGLAELRTLELAISKKQLLRDAIFDTLDKNEARFLLAKVILISTEETSKCSECGISLSDDILSAKTLKEFGDLAFSKGTIKNIESKRYLCSNQVCLDVAQEKELKIKEESKTERTKREEFWAQQNLKREQYIAELKALPYKSYLETEHWKQLRKKAYWRARYRCELCYSDSKLNVHHKTYERRGEEPLSDLIVLCENCHKKHHDVKEDEF